MKFPKKTRIFKSAKIPLPYCFQMERTILTVFALGVILAAGIFLSENVSVAGKVRQVRIICLDVEPEHLRLVLSAEGRVRARVQAIP